MKQTCEPLYAQRLQSLDVSNYDSSGEITKQPLLLRKQSSYDSRKCDSPVNSSLGLKPRRKVTLDNPAILEQQLEALEHHKKQLEKRGKLNQNFSNNSKSNVLHLNAPKLSTSSLLTDDLTSNSFMENSNVTYANTIHSTTPSSTGASNNNSKLNIYGNIITHPSNATSNIYSNVAYNKEEQEQTCAGEQTASLQQMPLLNKKSITTASDDNTVYFANNGSIIAEDEIPPPPSPVSSSYSELRRATEVFKTYNTPKKDAINAAADEIGISKSIIGYEVPHDQKISGDMRQMYINKPAYPSNEAFNKYNTGIQVY